MNASRITCVVLLSTVLGWTTQPLFFSSAPATDSSACPSELDKEVDLEKLELTGLDTSGPLAGIREVCLARLGDTQACSVKVLARRVYHLRGPPTA